ncbi:hypothetical protein AL038_12120 [Beggiatoa leptomitoformis]|nr:hypothetical protein AL038_12120 [Beggiatoa leptomitoformis]
MLGQQRQVLQQGFILLVAYLLSLIWLTVTPYQQISPNVYFILSHQLNYVLISLLFLILSIALIRPLSHPLLSSLLGAMIGFILFNHTLGLAYLDPRQIGWVMHNDWQFNFLAWQFFRAEEWQFPIGKISHYIYPTGSSIGYADTVPLMALLFKPFNHWLPYHFQYLGFWLCLCFCLQGVLGTLLIRRFTQNIFLQVLGATLFVLSPVLLMRMGHVALCAHWLLLAGIYFYIQPTNSYSNNAWLGWWLLLAVISALIHPYLAVMVLGMMVAFYARLLLERYQSILQVIMQLGFIGGVVLLTWWQAGFFLIHNTQSVVTQVALGYFSMNLLAPLDSMGLFLILPAIKQATTGQYEGFNYFGVGGILLSVWAIYALIRFPIKSVTRRFFLPFFLLSIGFTLFALSNKATMSDVVLWEWNNQFLFLLNVFQSSGRFFWVVNYFILLSSIGLLLRRYSTTKAGVLLGFIVVIQLVDFLPFHEKYIIRQADNATFVWENPLSNPIWEKAAPYYQHIVMVGAPDVCGESAGDYAPFAYLAAKNGLTLNAGRAARVDIKNTLLACEQQRLEIEQGHVENDSIYILHPTYAGILQANTTTPLLCKTIDTMYACVTQQSSQAWLN